ncbi:MAG: hypothetical protein PHW66_09470 [Gallionella sp.]|nr:hypothetical protein [Gallionella sp.]
MKTAAQRLQQYRDEALNPRWVRPLTWRDTKQFHPSAWGAPRPNNVRGQKGEVFTDSIDQYGDDLGPVGKLYPRMIDHNGWYSDTHYDALIVGHVCRMRCPRGTLYIPATLCTGWDGTVHYLGDAELVPKGATEEEHDRACREAARSADHYAEREAEEAREDNAKSLAESDIEQAREEIHGINQTTLSLIREIKQHGKKYTPAVCIALASTIKAGLRDRAEQFKIIKAREEDYWTAAPGY